MNFSAQNSSPLSETPDSSMLQKQLEKEVICLVRQLDEVRTKGESGDYTMLKNYENMIERRRKMLHNLPGTFSPSL